MSIIELLFIAVSLSMDAFAVSVCKGLSAPKLRVRNMAIAGIYFGGFQAIMPLIGYFLGVWLSFFISSVSHWVAFILLSLIGINMIRESRSKETESLDNSFSPKTMIPLAIATSIDALAVGVTFACLKVDIALSAGIIGIVTFILSAVGVALGNVIGAKFKNKAEFFGGLVLIIIGLKILIEHFIA